MVAKDEGDTEEEQQEGDQEDQGELLLQVGQPEDDRERKAAHDNPLAIEHLDEEPDVALVPLHIRAAAVGWAEARHCRGFFNTSTHGESS